MFEKLRTNADILSCRYNNMYGNIEIIIKIIIKPDMYKHYIVELKSLLGGIGATYLYICFLLVAASTSIILAIVTIKILTLGKII